MALTTEQLQAKRDALVNRIADGVKAQAIGDKSITFADIDQMQKALAVLDSEIANTSSSRTNRCVLVQHSNG